jgi:4-aminobutyrate aminotransferase-like enzyme
MAKLIADLLRQDPRYLKAKELLLQALQEAQSKLTGVKAPNPSLADEYEEMVKRMGHYRSSDLFFPYLGSGIGRGALVELADGSVKYDFINGIGAHFGHSLEEIILATFDAAASDTVMQGNLQQNRESLHLMEQLTTLSKRDHCFLSTSGAMACINGLKLAFYKHQPATRVLAFDKCFMGRTISLSQITDKPTDRVGLPSNLFVDYIPFYDPSKPDESTNEAAKRLVYHLDRHPREYAVMAFELIQGEGGFNMGSRDFFIALMKILRERDVAILIDEVQTFGRTSRLFAFQHFGLEEYADIVCFGKLSQVCGTLFQEKYVPPRVLLSQTFTSSSSAIQASLAILHALTSNGHFGDEGKNMTLHRHFAKRLEQIARRHSDWVSGPYGCGGMVAFTPFDGSPNTANHLVHTLYQNGVLSFTAGRSPSRIRFLMPLGGVTEQDIDAVCKILEESLEETACSISGQ